MTQPTIHWLTTDRHLTEAAKQWRHYNWVTLDTEFVRTKTFWPEAGLIQLGHGDVVWLVDPLTINDWQPLRELLLDESVIKVMHAMGEDLELFRYLLGVLPKNVFDSQIAATYAGLDFSIGYQRLIATLLGIEISKGETRSDWLARPLSDSQISYAALDVFYLGQAYPLLMTRLEERGMTEWHREDCETQIECAATDSDPMEAWRDVKMAWQLRPEQLAVLQTLCDWRETEARRLNYARNRLIPSAALWDLARYQPRRINEIRRIKAMKPPVLNQFGIQILQLIEEGRTIKPEHFPEQPSGPLPKQVKPVVEEIKNFCRNRADELGLAPELIPAKPWSGKLLRIWMNSGTFTIPKHREGWRTKEVLLPMIEHLSSLDFPTYSMQQQASGT